MMLTKDTTTRLPDFQPNSKHFSVALALLAIITLLDYFRPLEKSFSIFYLVPVLYAGWLLRGSWEWSIHFGVLFASFLVPFFSNERLFIPPTMFNRFLGVLVGAVVVLLMHERRRYADALIAATSELESRVAERTAALESANEELRHLVEVKMQFLRNMSHELRTPMNGIMGMTALVLDTPLSDSQRVNLQFAMASAKSLLGLLNDMLDLSKLEAGKVELARQPFDLHQKVNEITRMLATAAAAKDLELICELEPNVPRQVTGDPQRLGQVLINLVGNAIKFTNRGEVHLLISCLSQESPSRPLHFAVRDTGIGIAEQDQVKVFEPFWQADGSLTRRFEGTGLGLGISFQLVQAMGGHLRVQSDLGRGSTFSFQVVLDPTGPPPDLPLLSQRVLLLVSNPASRGFLDRCLQRLGVQTILAESPASALELLGPLASDLGKPSPPIDAILMDTYCSEAVWWESAESALLLHPALRKIALGIPTESAASKKVGWHAFVSKPIQMNELIGALSPGSISPTAEAAAPTATPTRSLRILLAEDNAVNQHLILQLLKKQSHNAHIAADGLAAVEAYKKEPFDLILMDIQMPGMNGVEATRSIRRLEQQSGRHTPIVALTAHAMKSDQESFLASGMDAYLSKPIHAADLFQAIRQLCP